MKKTHILLTVSYLEPPRRTIEYELMAMGQHSNRRVDACSVRHSIYFITFNYLSEVILIKVTAIYCVYGIEIILIINTHTTKY